MESGICSLAGQEVGSTHSGAGFPLQGQSPPGQAQLSGCSHGLCSGGCWLGLEVSFHLGCLPPPLSWSGEIPGMGALGARTWGWRSFGLEVCQPISLLKGKEKDLLTTGKEEGMEALLWRACTILMTALGTQVLGSPVLWMRNLRPSPLNGLAAWKHWSRAAFKGRAESWA